MNFGVGTCGVTFGMKPVDVVKKLGMPDKINVCDDDDIYEQTYTYNKFMLIVWFERDEDLSVTLIQCFSPDMTVFGRKLFLSEKEDVVGFLKNNGCTEFEDTDTPTEETLFFSDISAWFNFEFNRLTYIEMGAFISGDTDEDWRERE